MHSRLAPLALVAALSTAALAAQTPPPVNPPLPVQLSAAFDWNALAVKPTPVGSRRDVTDLPTRTLERLECHISTLNSGQASHPPHVHPQEELIVLKEGELEVFINGQTQHVGPGSLFFFASYDQHCVRNIGSVPATYLVFNFASARTKTVPAQRAADTASPDLLRSQVFDWTRLDPKPTKVGSRRGVFDSPTVTCTRLESHVTTLHAGLEPHPAHHHPDEELVVVKDGTMQATINGVTHTGGPGSIFFFASNDQHGLKNVGDGDAAYYIIRVATEKTPPKDPKA